MRWILWSILCFINCQRWRLIKPSTQKKTVKYYIIYYQCVMSFDFTYYLILTYVFVLFFEDHLKMKKTSTKSNSSDVHTTHKSSSTWGQVVDHKSSSCHHPSNPGSMLNLKLSFIKSSRVLLVVRSLQE